MSAGTSEFFCLICFLVCSCTAQEKITAEPGQDVILPCKVPNINNINNITAAEWIRPVLDPDHVLLYRDEQLDVRSQHPSYQNRVDLQDKEMKDGDISLILKNVTKDDTGKYVCRVSQKGKTEPFSIIYLEVVEPDHSRTRVGLVVVLLVCLLLAAAVFLYLYRHNRKRKTLERTNQQLEKINSDISKQLEEEKQKIETLNSHLEKWMKMRRNLQNSIQKKIQELKEVISDTNSDPTGSFKENPQEELEKLQEENQKLMETGRNLQTEPQNMNQELKLEGPITVVDVHERGDVICPQNTSSEEIELEGWKLQLQRNNSEPVIWIFKESDRIQAEDSFTVRCTIRFIPHPDDLHLWPEMKWRPEDKVQFNLINNKGEIFRLLEYE